MAGEHSSQLGTRTWGACTGGHIYGRGRTWVDGLGQKWVFIVHGSCWLLAGPSEPDKVRAMGNPGGSQDKTCERGFPCTASPVQGKNKQTPLLFFIFNWQWSSRGGVTLSRAQPALSLLTAQKRCLWTQIPTFSSLEAVKMYFLLCHFSFWQAGSQVGLENVKVGNKVVR